MLNRALMVLVLLAGVATPSLSARAQDSVSFPVRVPAARSWTEQEIRDACAHKPGAPMRLYGCSAKYLDSAHPLYIIDGVKFLARDSTGPSLARRDSLVAAALASPSAALTVLKSTEAIALYGVDGEHGAVRITTTPSPKTTPTP
jgi:hypothetical protein